MNDYQEVFGKLEAAIEGIESLKKAAYKQYSISYNKLWKLLIDRKMSNTDLRRVSGICPNTLTKLRRDQEVSTVVLERRCTALGVNIWDIMECSEVSK